VLTAAACYGRVTETYEVYRDAWSSVPQIHGPNAVGFAARLEDPLHECLHIVKNDIMDLLPNEGGWIESYPLNEALN
jgi:hypothetical protein